jgi:hypothetical protein
MRDFGFLKRPSVLIALGSALLLGVSVISLGTIDRQQNPLEGVLEGVSDIANPKENSP